MKNLEDKLIDIKNKNLFRKLKYLESPQDKNIVIDGREILLMASNNYLGLANRKELKECAIEGIRRYGVGSGGSRLTTGSYTAHKQLEDDLSKFFKRDKALVFNNGYVANVGIIQAICDETYTIISDEENHASIIDGCRMTKAKKMIFKHNDMNSLEKCLKLANGNKLIITEGVFSMSGDISKLDEIVKLAKKYEARVMVDDAHGIGVLGSNGRGILEHYNLNNEIDIYMGTLSKAIGVEGGFVCGSNDLIDYLINKARGFIYSTSIAPHLCMASSKSLELMEKENLTQKLNTNIKYFYKKFRGLFKDIKCESAIIKIQIGDEKKAVKISEILLENNIYIPAIRYPTVKKGEAILRVCIMSTHTVEDIDRVYEVINNYNSGFLFE